MNQYKAALIIKLRLWATNCLLSVLKAETPYTIKARASFVTTIWFDQILSRHLQQKKLAEKTCGFYLILLKNS